MDSANVFLLPPVLSDGEIERIEDEVFADRAREMMLARTVLDALADGDLAARDLQISYAAELYRLGLYIEAMSGECELVTELRDLADLAILHGR